MAEDIWRKANYASHMDLAGGHGVRFAAFVTVWPSS